MQPGHTLKTTDLLANEVSKVQMITGKERSIIVSCNSQGKKNPGHSSGDTWMQF